MSYGASLREMIYGGVVVRLPPSEAARALVSVARNAVVAELGEPIRTSRLSAGDHHAAIVRARAAVARAHDEARAVAIELGLEPHAIAIDAPRLRAVTHDGHRIVAAAPAYYAHRDTWYANPRAQLNVWIPLHDVTEEDTFEIFHDAFGIAVANDSATFDFEVFAREVGWQRPDPPPGASYPRALDVADRVATPVVASEAETVVFSGAHLHRTRAHAAGKTRFSVDVRIVDLRDHDEGKGAPDVDNASRGSALPTYTRGA